MRLDEIGTRARARREELGLSQERVAKFAGLSRATVNQLERGSLNDLGVAKLASLLDLLGLRLDATSIPPRSRGLVTASRTASVSYKRSLDPMALADALASGELPFELEPYAATLLDEAPLSMLVRAVEEAARIKRIPPKRVWRHLLKWSAELGSPRRAWA